MLMGALFSCFTGSGIRLHSHEVRIISELGKGGFSDVYLVEDVRTHARFALKKMMCQTPERMLLTHEQMAQNEITYLRKFEGCPHIVKLYDSRIDEASQLVWMLLEFAPRGTLEGKQADMTYADMLFVFLGICEGVLRMHNATPPIAHRDLKPGNVLLGEANKPLLMDFGSVSIAQARITNRKEALLLQDWCQETCSVSPLLYVLYRAPELFDISSDSYITEKTDVWSLGGILYYMMYGKSPFDDAYAQGSVELAALSANINFPPGPRSKPGVIEVVRWIMNPDPFSRPTLQQVIDRVNALPLG